MQSGAEDGSPCATDCRTEYYTGFEEVRLTARSRWREVPWLDAGAKVEGPAVAALDRSFLDAWTAAGGAPFEIAERPAVGAVAVRVVLHHGFATRARWTRTSP